MGRHGAARRVVRLLAARVAGAIERPKRGRAFAGNFLGAMDVWKTSVFTKDLLEYINHADEPRGATEDVAGARDEADDDEGDGSRVEAALQQYQQNSM